jgi:hypothetical protein
MRRSTCRIGSGLLLAVVVAACTGPGATGTRPTTGARVMDVSAATTLPPRPATGPASPPTGPTASVTAGSPAVGPVEAALGFLELTERVMGMTPQQAADVQAQISSDDARAALVADTRAEMERTAAAYEPGTIHVQVTPLATRRTDSPDGVTVGIWYLGVVTVDHGTATSYFRTATYGLVWEHDSWRMTALESTPGPTPTPGQAAVVDSAEQLAGALHGFTPVTAGVAP